MNSIILCILSSVMVFTSGAGFIPRKIQMPFVVRCFAGVSLCSLALIPILYINAKLINIFIPSMIIVGILNMGFQNYRKIRQVHITKLPNVIHTRKIVLFVFIYLAVSVAFLDFFPTNYIYSDHDLLYWSWATNFHAIDYSGTLQSEIAWPMAFTSNHLLPGMLLGYLNYLSPIQNLSGIILLKYFVVTFAITFLLVGLINHQKSRFFWKIPFFVILLALFRSELSYNFLISNYLATLIMLIILWVMYAPGLENRNFLLSILFFILSFSKFILFPIGIVLSLMFYLRSTLKQKWFFAGFSLLIGISNIYIWVFMERPADSAAITAYNPFNPDFFIQYLRYVEWITDPFLRLPAASGFRFMLAGFLIAVVIAKVFLLFGFFYRKLFAKFLEQKNEAGDEFFFAASWLIFMSYAILGHIFIRFNSYSIQHSAQLVYLASTITFFFACMYFSKMVISRIQSILIVVLMFFFVTISPYRINDGFSLVSHMREINSGSLVSPVLNGDRFMRDNTRQTHPQLQLQSSILGQKLGCSDSLSDRALSPIYSFLYLKEGDSC